MQTNSTQTSFHSTCVLLCSAHARPYTNDYSVIGHGESWREDREPPISVSDKAGRDQSADNNVVKCPSNMSK
jgi:hypothetical protein